MGEGLMDKLGALFRPKAAKTAPPDAEIYTGTEVEWKNPEVATAQFMELTKTHQGEALIRATKMPLSQFKDAIVVDQLGTEQRLAVYEETLRETVNRFNNVVRLILNIGSPTNEDRAKLVVALQSGKTEEVQKVLGDLADKYRYEKPEFTEEDRRNIREADLKAMRLQAQTAAQSIIEAKGTQVRNGEVKIEQQVLDSCAASLRTIMETRFRALEQ